jgi:putative FmdB family regulatory protein
MPTYDYRCRACNHEWEVFQSIKANPIRKCPECGKLKAQRQIGRGAGIIFKGSGFYQTDYRSSAYKKAAEADKPKTDSAAKSESKSGGDSSGGKSESKPAAKASD